MWAWSSSCWTGRMGAGSSVDEDDVRDSGGRDADAGHGRHG
jgi:hypothetical protein